MKPEDKDAKGENNEDRGDNLTAEEQAQLDAMKAEAEKKGEEVSDDDIAAAVAAMRGEKPGDKDSDKSDDDKGKKGKEGNMVPQSRFDEAVKLMREQNEALQARLDEIQRAQVHSNEPKVNPIQKMQQDLETARDAWEDALMDGDKDKARAARQKIASLETHLQQVMYDQAANSARTASAVDIRYEALLENLEKQFPVINPESEHFDKATMQRVARISNALQNDPDSPMTADKALQEAADVVLGKPAGGNRVSEDLRDRKDGEKKAAAAAVARQGADLNNLESPRGKVEPVLKPSKLTDKQLHSLPDDVKAQLRGDMLTPEQMEK